MHVRPTILFLRAAGGMPKPATSTLPSPSPTLNRWTLVSLVHFNKSTTADLNVSSFKGCTHSGILALTEPAGKNTVLTSNKWFTALAATLQRLETFPKASWPKG
jgi:hypothetical protein